MQNLIDDVTRRLVSRLPETKAYYSLTDLHDFQIPSFIITRIELELRKNLADSIVPPATDWANMKSANVKSSWDQFLKAIHEQVRLPRSYARSVLEVAVADVLDLLIEPRKNMVDMIFGSSTDLKFEEVRQAASYVTVYPYLPDSLIKYMHRKQLQTISKEKAQQILVLVDEKLTEKYTPLNWAQLIDPLFVLLGEEIESEAFRLFFLDKNKERWSEFFDKEKDDITRTRFIELLSTPELDGIEQLNESNDGTNNYLTRPYYGKPAVLVSESFETAQAESEFVPETESEPEKVEDDVPIGKVRDWGLADSDTEILPPILENTGASLQEIYAEQAEESNENGESEESEHPVELKWDETTPQEDQEAQAEVEELEILEQTVSSDFVENEQIEAESEFIAESIEEIEEIPQETELNQPEEIDSEVETEFVEDSEIEEIPEVETVELETHSDDVPEEITLQTEETLATEELHEDDEPIYKKMASTLESTTEQVPLAEQVKAKSTTQEDIPFWKRFVSHTEVEEPVVENETDKSDEILAHLKDMESEFITEIFGGDANAYIESIDELAQFEHWDQASNYIRKEIYKINQVDLYSEASIDFIERLQTYFNSKG